MEVKAIPLFGFFFDDDDRYTRCAAFENIEFTCCGRGKIDNAPFDEGTAVIDAYFHGPLIAQIGYTYHRAKG